MMQPARHFPLKIEQLKSVLFDLTTNSYFATNRSALLEAFVSQLKQFLCADGVGFYSYNKCKGSYYLQNSSFNNEEKVSQTIPIEAYEAFTSDVSNQSEVVYAGEGLLPELSSYQTVILQFDNSDMDEYKDLLFFFYDNELDIKKFNNLLLEVKEECMKLFEYVKRNHAFHKDEERYEQLYRVTAKFHSSMNIKDVLREIIHTLEKVYPSFENYLLMSQDTEELGDLPVKGLQYDGSTISHSATQAYLTGHVQFEDRLLEDRSVLYAPLKGKQGIYGVLQVMAPNAIMFTKQEVDFVELLANTAGNALENAQLYQQSKQLIDDLRLINKTSHRLNSNLRLFDTVQFMKEQIVNSFGAQEVGFFMFPNGDEAQLLEGSTSFFKTPAARVILHSLVERIRENKDSLFISDLENDDLVSCRPYRSLLVVPMVQSGELKGGIIAFHKHPYFFTFEKFKLLESLVHHSTLAFVNSMLREKLEEMVITDYLTKLYSRNFLDDYIQKAMDTDHQGTFLLIDIDNFKLINDTFGHQVGDEIIIQVAELIRSNIRKDDIASRWGGEELAVYLPLLSLEEGIDVAKRLVKSVPEDTEPKITISCGVAYWSRKRKDSVKSLFNRADEALYEAKRTGKNKVIIHKTNL
ncbi:hypothetical protein BFG57_03440 [Bacillus solimangrovi]|uniref:GGDEF domain-containing protein n=2 Tax=Bacillus solimangrovi TaxID=1305675 RepID=A0A1E5LCW0_9BACI|nr:hypothetical protein BFG57_03440 [Bacillus solimangrovi]